MPKYHYLLILGELAHAIGSRVLSTVPENELFQNNLKVSTVYFSHFQKQNITTCIREASGIFHVTHNPGDIKFLRSSWYTSYVDRGFVWCCVYRQVE